MILHILLFVLLSSPIYASANLDFNELRLKKMAKVMNSRDFDLMLSAIRQLEILNLACEKEKLQSPVPVTCFELSEKLHDFDASLKLDLSLFAELCSRSSTEFSEADILKMNDKSRWLPAKCREKVTALAKILTYKKSGKRFE